MTRRAFLAAAFGASTARALPKPLKIMFTKVDYATKTVTVTGVEDFAPWGRSTYELQLAILMDDRPYILYGGGQGFLRADPTLFVPYCKNPRKYGGDLPSDGTRS